MNTTPRMRSLPVTLIACAGLLVLTSPVRAAVCSSESVRAPLPLREGLVLPVSPQLDGGPAALVFSGSPLGNVADERLALDRVLQRLRSKNCVVDEFADYVPKTQFDNTPYRFNMDSGKKFTAEEFEAWMKRRGVRIAKGNVASAAVVPVAATDTGAAPAAVPAAVDQAVIAE